MTKYAKAILSALIALIGGLITGYAGDNVLSTVEILTAVNLGLVSLVGVFMVPNKQEQSVMMTEEDMSAMIQKELANDPLLESMQRFLDMQTKNVVSHP